MKKKSTPRLDDLRTPGILKVPEGSYLVTGLPRIRSAWLAAVLTRDDAISYHEAPTEQMRPIDGKLPFGLFDPGAACLYPNFALKAFDRRKIVIIERDPAISRRALEKFAGSELPYWEAVESRYNQFRRYAVQPMIVPFKHLAQFDTVDRISKFVTGWPLSRARFDLFDGLRIEQDIVKRALAEAAKPAIAS